MKIKVLLLTALILSAYFPQPAHSQDGVGTHTFKIVGKTKVPTIQGEKTVEYNRESADHLYINDFNKNGMIVSKRQFLFKGKRFDQENMLTYLREKQLLPDGAQLFYLTDGSFGNEDVMKEGRLIKSTFFYPDGKKKLLFSGDENTLNGEYKIWYPTGQLSFSGNYENDLKDGEFQSFDESGVLIRKGLYQEGKLVSGEAVVHEMIYHYPEQPAEFINGDEAFDEYLKIRSVGIDGLKEISKEKTINLKLIIDKTGRITKIESQSNLLPNELEILNTVFKEMPEYTPALVENIPVISSLNLNLILSNQGLKRSMSNHAFINPEEMPHFPGGEIALRNYLSRSIKYPIEAQRQVIQGKVFVSFIVTEEGNISEIKVVRKVHPLLDIEAIRIVKNMPKWIPGIEYGKPVKVSYTLPINFSLR